ncbi:MAG: hypothetical protein JWR10_1744 [Rubritepida sp.]|nr:hypothetical protein [Rubritepida sp.]
MADINHVFARFHKDHADTLPKRELLSIPRKGSSNSTRTVEVVHVRSGASSKTNEQHLRESSVRAATWSEGFPTKPAPIRSPVELSAPIEPPQHAVHVMPTWGPPSAEPATLETIPQPQIEPRRRGRPRKIASTMAPIAADPFDPNDDGTNCLRCGLLVQPAREKRGMMTCGSCG